MLLLNEEYTLEQEKTQSEWKIFFVILVQAAWGKMAMSLLQRNKHLAVLMLYVLFVFFLYPSLTIWIASQIRGKFYLV